jgi:hypothetical protein
MTTNASSQNQKVRFIIFTTLGLALAGCGKDEIKTYSVPKETSAASQLAAANPGGAVNQGDVPGHAADSAPVRWATPASWEELAPTSMRVGNFLVKKGDHKAEVSIIPFPGSVGTELDNVNRWRGEIKLEPIAANELSSATVPIGSAEGKFYEFAGAEMATLAAVLQKDGTSWFFKMRGDKELVLESKATFLDFLKSIRFEASAAAAEKPVVVPKPISTNAKKAPPSAPADSDEPQWNIPSNWKETPAGMMVLKSFSVSDDAGHEAKISISAFPGDVGGTLANVNRWRTQLSLEPITQQDLPKETTSIDVLGGKATLVDVKGTDSKTGKPARLAAAMVRHGEKSWFYKLMGDEQVVGREKEAFLKFVETVRYPND